MAENLRWRALLTRADPDHVDEVADFDTYGLFTKVADRHEQLAASGSYTMDGFTLIKEVFIDSDGTSVNVELTKTGPTSFEFASSGVVLLHNVELIGVKVTNPGAVPISVRILAAGS